MKKTVSHFITKNIIADESCYMFYVLLNRND